MITIAQNDLMDIIQSKTGIAKDNVEKIVTVALTELKQLLVEESVKTTFGVLKLDGNKAVLEKENRRAKWLAKSDSNYQKVLETNGAWFQTDKGRNALKRSKVGVAKLIRSDYAFEVKRLRAETGLSQKEFGEFVGIAKSSLQAAEYGNAYLSDKRMRQMLIRLGYSGNDLVQKKSTFSSLAYPVSEVRSYLCEKLGIDFEKNDDDIDWTLVKDAIFEWKKLVRDIDNEVR